MNKQPGRLERSTTATSQPPAGEIDIFTTKTEYKSIFADKKCLCPYACYICDEILGDLIQEIYKKNWILNEMDSSIFSFFGKELIK